MIDKQLIILESIYKEYSALDKNDARGIVEFLRGHRMWVVGMADMTRYIYSPIDVLIRGRSIDQGIELFRQVLQHLDKDDKDLFSVMVHAIKVSQVRDIHHCFEKIAKMILVDLKETMPDNLRSLFWTEMLGFSFSKHHLRDDDLWFMFDNESLRKTLYEGRRKEYENIPIGLLFEQKVSVSVSEGIRNVLPKDDVAIFEITSTLLGQKLTVGMLQAILSYGASAILSHLLRHRLNEVSRILPPFDLLCCICARKTANPEFDVAMLNALEEIQPGISKMTDHLGNTPLWYCLYHLGTYIT